MPSITETIDRCRGDLEHAGIHAVLDPTLLTEPTHDQLQVLRQVISALKGSIRQIGVNDLSPEEIYQARLVLAHAFLHRGLVTKRFNEAYDTATRAIELYPLRSAAYRTRGHVSLLRGSKNVKWLKNATGDFNKARRYDSDDFVSQYGLALCHQLPALQRLDAAARLRKNGKHQSALDEISIAESELGHAVAQWGSLLEASADNGLALLNRGVCLARLGELEQAQVDLDNVCRLGEAALSWSHGRSGERLAVAHMERARIAGAKGRFKRALEDLRAAAAAHPPVLDAAALRDRAEIAMKARADDVVIEDCSSILKGGDDARALALRAQAHFNLEHFDLAKADASRILRRDGRDVTARFLRGRCAHALGAVQSSLVDLDRCLELDPDNRRILAERSKVRLAAEMYAEAAIDAQGALESVPEDGELHFTLGCALHHLGKLDDAKRALKRAREAGHEEAAAKIEQWYGS